ncbi:vitamin D3 hydroxylase-associated protein-like isoform X1 [Bufo bufo]|uniref:vitamin D3 hydroxylase-associated protein-like isoform X1 n=1 Tax=Bufo bufo TaxID=8384 RepID=UPI001ABDEBCE|nr:vitamin D3 hydroxylase-associated protein-like isoform X1 [Bufo bufo]
MLLKILAFLLPEFLVDLAFVFLLLGLVGSFLVLQWMRERSTKMKTERAQTQRDRSLELMEKTVLRRKSRHEDMDVSRILSLPLVELVEQLKKGSLSPETVLHVYMEKSLEVNKEVNCLTDFLSECETQVQEVKKQQEKGLLYGVPITLKDNIGYKGHNSTCGLVHFLGVEDAEDCAVVKVLKKQGAIPFVKTNVPQSLINFDCSNSIYGQTLNPHNHKKTCGGSSGGEGALIAGGGAILGVGTDVVGSIRMPSSFCGICGLKPSGERISNLGVLDPVSGMKSAVSMPGPMARDVDSLALFMKAVLCDDLFQLDPTVPPVPFNDEIYNSRKRLTIGFYDTDGYFLPHPSMRRAVQETKTLLEEAGHKLVPFPPIRIEYALNDLCVRGFFADGGTTLAEKFLPDIVDPNLKQQLFLYKIPNIVKKMAAFFMRPVFPRIANHVEAHCGCSSVKDLWKHYTAIKKYRCDFISEWRKLGLDALLCPMLSPAFNVGHPGKLFAGFGFTMLFNVLNLPVGVLPVTRVTAEDEAELKHYKGYYNDPWDKEVIKAMEGGVGLPVAVQCVALQWQEEQCLRLMKEVETATRGRVDPPPSS